MVKRHSKKFIAAGSQGRSIKKLNELRNDFIHFIPKGWSIEVSGIPQISIDCLAIIEFLGWDSGNIVWQKSSVQNRAEIALEKAKKTILTIEDNYKKNRITSEST